MFAKSSVLTPETSLYHSRRGSGNFSHIIIIRHDFFGPRQKKYFIREFTCSFAKSRFFCFCTRLTLFFGYHFRLIIFLYHFLTFLRLFKLIGILLHSIQMKVID